MGLGKSQNLSPCLGSPAPALLYFLTIASWIPSVLYNYNNQVNARRPPAHQTKVIPRCAIKVEIPLTTGSNKKPEQALAVCGTVSTCQCVPVLPSRSTKALRDSLVSDLPPQDIRTDVTPGHRTLP